GGAHLLVAAGCVGLRGCEEGDVGGIEVHGGVGGTGPQQGVVVAAGARAAAEADLGGAVGGVGLGGGEGVEVGGWGVGRAARGGGPQCGVIEGLAHDGNVAVADLLVATGGDGRGVVEQGRVVQVDGGAGGSVPQHRVRGVRAEDLPNLLGAVGPVHLR